MAIVTPSVLQGGVDMMPAAKGDQSPYDPRSLSAQRAFGMVGTGAGFMGAPFGTGTMLNALGRAIDTSRANNYTANLGLGRPVSYFSWSSPGQQAIDTVQQEQNREAARGYAMGAQGYGLSPDSGGLGSDGSPGGPGSGPGGEGMGNGGNAWTQGGPVTLDRLAGPDPAGPDDGYGALQGGEFVVRAAAARKLGQEALQKINAGDFKTRALIEALKR